MEGYSAPKSCPEISFKMGYSSVYFVHCAFSDYLLDNSVVVS